MNRRLVHITAVCVSLRRSSGLRGWPRYNVATSSSVSFVLCVLCVLCICRILCPLYSSSMSLRNENEKTHKLRMRMHETVDYVERYKLCAGLTGSFKQIRSTLPKAWYGAFKAGSGVDELLVFRTQSTGRLIWYFTPSQPVDWLVVLHTQSTGRLIGRTSHPVKRSSNWSYFTPSQPVVWLVVLHTQSTGRLIGRTSHPVNRSTKAMWVWVRHKLKSLDLPDRTNCSWLAVSRMTKCHTFWTSAYSGVSLSRSVARGLEA